MAVAVVKEKTLMRVNYWIAAVQGNLQKRKIVNIDRFTEESKEAVDYRKESRDVFLNLPRHT